MESICGADCNKCELNNKCKGCKNTNGCPFGKQCFIANYINVGGKEKYELIKRELINEINSLNIDGMPKINELYPLHGSFVNLEYNLNGNRIKLLDDNDTYLGNQIECEFNNDETKSYFGIVSNMNFLLICSYNEDITNPEIIVYKKR